MQSFIFIHMEHVIRINFLSKTMHTRARNNNPASLEGGMLVASDSPKEQTIEPVWRRFMDLDV